MSAKILENDVHVFVVSWRTQEVLAYRDLKTNERSKVSRKNSTRTDRNGNARR
jgi:hypothetical protein